MGPAPPRRAREIARRRVQHDPGDHVAPGTPGAALAVAGDHSDAWRYLHDVVEANRGREGLLALNRMGRIPILTDGDTAISETSAIGMYLSDRYSPGNLTPTLDDPDRGPWLRWCVFAPSVIEPSCMAKSAGLADQPGLRGLGSHEAMLGTLEHGFGEGAPWLLGERFTMADVIVGARLMFMLRFKMIEEGPLLKTYTERLSARPAMVAAQKHNDEMRAKHAPEN